MNAAPRGAIYDQSDAAEPAVVTWSVDLTVPERFRLGHGTIREDEPVLARHAEALDQRARQAGWRMSVRPAAAAKTAESVMLAGIGADPLADRRAALARRLERGRAWAVELAGGTKARKIAAREGVSDTWVRFEVLLGGLDPEIVEELLRPGSLAAALSNEALREIARRKSALAQRGLFWPLVRQLQRKAAAGTVTAPPVRAGGKASFAFLLARARGWQARIVAGESMAKIAASERLTRQVVWYWSQVLTLPSAVLETLEQAEDLPGVTLAALVKLTKIRGAAVQVAAFRDLIQGDVLRASA